MARMMRLLAAWLCFTAAATLVAAAGLPQRAAYTGTLLPGELPIAPEVGAIAPPFQTQSFDGTPFDLLNLRGRTVILNFWATWCAPCRVEMPELQAFHEAHPDVVVVGVNLGETPEAVAAWAARYGLTFDLVLDPDGRTAALYALRGQPSTYVITPGGVISHIVYGATTQSALEQAAAPR